MVTRRRLRSILTAIGLYVVATALIGYFAVHAYSGNHGLRAKEDLVHQMAELGEELDRVKAERTQWQRRVMLLKSDRLDPDMLDERARVLLSYQHPQDVTIYSRRP